MTYRVQVHKPLRDAGDFGNVDRLVVNSPADVTDRDGVLLVTCVGQPSRPHPVRHDITIPETRSSLAVYPRGGWIKAIISDVVDEGEEP